MDACLVLLILTSDINLNSLLLGLLFEMQMLRKPFLWKLQWSPLMKSCFCLGGLAHRHSFEDVSAKRLFQFCPEILGIILCTLNGCYFNWCSLNRSRYNYQLFFFSLSSDWTISVRPGSPSRDSRGLWPLGCIIPKQFSRMATVYGLPSPHRKHREGKGGCRESA